MPNIFNWQVMSSTSKKLSKTQDIRINWSCLWNCWLFRAWYVLLNLYFTQALLRMAMTCSMFLEPCKFLKSCQAQSIQSYPQTSVIGSEELTPPSGTRSFVSRFFNKTPTYFERKSKSISFTSKHLLYGVFEMQERMISRLWLYWLTI